MIILTLGNTCYTALTHICDTGDVTYKTVWNKRRSTGFCTHDAVNRNYCLFRSTSQ